MNPRTRRAPTPTMPVQIPNLVPYIDISSGSRNRPQPAPSHQNHTMGEEVQDRPLTPLPELELATTDTTHAPPLSHSPAYRHAHAQAGVRGCAVARCIEYPALLLIGRLTRHRGMVPTKAVTKEVQGIEAPLSPLVVASGCRSEGCRSEGRLMPRRNITLMRQCWSSSSFRFSQLRAAFLNFLGASYGPTVCVLDALLTTLNLTHEFLHLHSLTSFINISDSAHTYMDESLIPIHDRRLRLSSDLCCCARKMAGSIALRWLRGDLG
jgi:hypothetical protein